MAKTTYRVEYVDSNRFIVIGRTNGKDRIVDEFPDEESAEMHREWLRERAAGGVFTDMGPAMLQVLKRVAAVTDCREIDPVICAQARRIVSVVEAATK